MDTGISYFESICWYRVNTEIEPMIRITTTMGWLMLQNDLLFEPVVKICSFTGHSYYYCNPNLFVTFYEIRRNVVQNSSSFGISLISNTLRQLRARNTILWIVWLFSFESPNFFIFIAMVKLRMLSNLEYPKGAQYLIVDSHFFKQLRQMTATHRWKE